MGDTFKLNGRSYTVTGHYLSPACGGTTYVAAPIHLGTSSTSVACSPEFILTGG